MISKTETIKKIERLKDQIAILQDKKELKILEYDEKIENLRKNAEKEKSAKISLIEEKFNAQKMHLDEERGARIAQLDEILSATMAEKAKYDKVLEAIITQENAIKALLGENY